MVEGDFEDCVNLSSHYKAIGQTRVFLHSRRDDASRPWDYITKVESGCAFRLGVPTGVNLTAEHPCGLTFEWSVEFEDFGANGTGTNKFDPNAVMGLATKLPKPAQKQLAQMLRDKVRPELTKRLDEIRSAMLTQHQSVIAVYETLLLIDGIA